MVYALLGGLAGAFGLHNFYAGFDRRGALQLLLSFIGVGLPFALAMAVCDLWFEKFDAGGRMMEESGVGGVIGVFCGLWCLLLAALAAGGGIFLMCF